MTDHPSALVSVPETVIAACEGEQEHFEGWAKSSRYDMSEHPLHYIFLDPKTDAARMGWNAALAYVRNSAAPAAPQAAGVGEGDELDLYDDKVQAGIAWTMRQWGETLGLKTWMGGDGSESVEGDVGAEIHTILVDAGLRDPETNEMAALRAPSREPEGGAVLDERGTYLRDNLDVVLRAVEDMARIGIEVAKQGTGYQTEARDRARIDFVSEVCRRWAALATREEAPAEAGVAQRVMSRADLTNATTPGHADAYLNALLDYTAGFYGEAREAGMPATSVADAMNHVERAARGLHALALRAQPQAREDAQPVGYLIQVAGSHKNHWRHATHLHATEADAGKALDRDPDGDIIPLYTHPRPAPDALRVAVEALEKIRCRRGIGPVTRSIAVEALQALAALQAEQKGGA